MRRKKKEKEKTEKNSLLTWLHKQTLSVAFGTF
jgi:hypothetical protein